MSKSRKTGHKQFYDLIILLRKALKEGHYTMENLPINYANKKLAEKYGYETGLRNYSKDDLYILLTDDQDPTLNECRLVQKTLNKVLKKDRKYRNRQNNQEQDIFDTARMIEHLKAQGYRILKPITEYEEV